MCELADIKSEEDSDDNTTCKLCLKNLSSKHALSRHVRFVHVKEDKPFKCDQCEYRGFKKYIVDRHIEQVHLKQGQVECPTCLKSSAPKVVFQDM